jgi:hypothetical protein
MIAELPGPLSGEKSPFVVSRVGNLAICNMCKSSPPGAPLTAILLASSLLSSFAAERRPGSSSK